MIVIFDLDGTIADSFEAHYLSFKEAFEEILGISPKWEEIFKLFGLEGREIIEKVLEKYGMGRNGEIVERILKRKNELTRKYFGKIRLREGVLEMLKYLKEKGLKIALLSNSSREDVMNIVDYLGIGEFFDVIISVDDIRKGKPDPEGIMKIMEILKDKDVVYVGDRDVDRETAERAGVRYFGIEEFLKKYKEII